MGEYTNSRTFNIIAWGTVVLVTVMTLAYFVLLAVRNNSGDDV